MIKLKKILNENMLGDLPSSKLMKMKWNPITEAESDIEPVEEATANNDNTQYSWGQINNAFMAQGTPPSKILRFLSVLKQQR